ILILFCSLFSLAIFAQSDKYQKAMESNLAKLEQPSSPEQFIELANNFERIAEAEKTQWLPYYYAAYAQVMNGLMMSQAGPAPDKTDPIADKAEALLEKATAIKGEHAEIFIIKKMISNLRMTADPMNRWQTYGPMGAEALAQAKKLDPQNPRVVLLEGQDKFYTPEQFGGSKSEAKILFEESIKRFESHKPASSIDPNWGLNQAKYFFGLAN
ncbi:MAG: hypothetical protein ACXWV4_12055, partial [Flavitalea sp.]